MNDELSSGAQDFLSLATSEGDVSPNDADRRRVRKGVGVALAATSAAGVAASAGSASAAAGSAAIATSGLGLKALMVAALVTVAGAGALSISGPDAVDTSPSTSSSARGPEVAPPTEPTEPSVPALPVVEPTNEAVPEAPTPSVVAPEVASSAVLAPAPAPVPEHSASARPGRARVIPAAPLEEAPSTMSLSDELGLLRAAQRARVQGNFDEALRQLNEHSRRFPAGRLAAERDGTRVFVLCDATRPAEATSAQRAFLRDHATSPLAHRVRSGCD